MSDRDNVIVPTIGSSVLVATLFSQIVDARLARTHINTWQSFK